MSCPVLCRYTFNGGLCNLPFAHHGKLEYDCLGASNGTAGLCKDAAGAWQACVATHRRGKVSSKPCILPATISARDGFVSGAGITAASSAGGGDTGDAADDTDATDSAASIGGADDKQMLVTDCFWQQQEASGQQQQQYKEVCYTDAETLEECTTSGYGLTGGNIGHGNIGHTLYGSIGHTVTGCVTFCSLWWGCRSKQCVTLCRLAGGVPVVNY